MDTIKIDHGTVRMVAHRGVSGIETENTCAAFVAAGNRSYFGVETDVHVTADGQLLLYHDDHTGRLAPVDLVMEQTDAATLQALPLRDSDGGDFTRTDLHIPALRDYLRICRKYGKACVLELKNPMPAQAIADIAEAARAEGWLEQMIFISFAHENLVELRRLLPTAKLQFLTCDAPDEALLARLLPWKLDLDIRYLDLTKEGVALMHQNGVEVNCWTVDDPAEAARMVAWGVDYITSNILE